jgi:lysozyme
MKKLIFVGIITIILSTVVVLNFNRFHKIKYKVLSLFRNSEEVIKTNKAVGYIWGIDISHHQVKIDWDILVKENKPSFAYLKATEGSTFNDPQFVARYKKMKSLRIPTGAYHFFTYQSNGKSQAANFINILKLSKGDLLPALDLEFRNSKLKSTAWIKNEIKSFCTEIKSKYGIYPVIYCENDYKIKYLSDSFFNDFKYWISDFYREPKSDYDLWQYSDKGSVNGIGNVDVNRLRKGLKLSDCQF